MANSYADESSQSGIVLKGLPPAPSARFNSHKLHFLLASTTFRVACDIVAYAVCTYIRLLYFIKNCIYNHAHHSDYNEQKMELFDAIRNNDIAALQRLIDGGADVNVKDENGDTPLYIAIYHDRILAPMLLIEAGADVNATNGRGDTPLHMAARDGGLDVMDALIRRHANIDAMNLDGDTPLHMACWCGGTLAAKMLIDNGANVNVMNAKGNTPLLEHLLECEDHIFGIVTLLVRSGADLHVENEDGESVKSFVDRAPHLRRAVWRTVEEINLLRQHQRALVKQLVRDANKHNILFPADDIGDMITQFMEQDIDAKKSE